MTDLLRLAVVSCAYDTGFTPLAPQIEARLAQLAPLEGARLYLASPDDAFTHVAQRFDAERVRAVPAPGAAKGRALRLALTEALKEDFDAFAYINLNL